MSISKDGADNVRQIIVCNMESLRLKRVSTRSFIQFKRTGELYEMQIIRTNKEPNSNISPISLKALVHDVDLQTFLAAGWITMAFIDETTETKIGESIWSRCNKDVNGKNLSLINEAVSNVTEKMCNLEDEDRDWFLHL